MPVRIAVIVLATLLVGASGLGAQVHPDQARPDQVRSELVRFEVADEAGRQRFSEWKEEILSGTGGRHRLAFKGLAEDTSQFILPIFRVNRVAAGGTTTLWAVRNADTSSTTISVTYLDEFLDIFATRSYALGPTEVRTVNLRDVPGLPPAASDGISRGTVIITGPAGADLSGDFFQVDPAGNFATGDRLVDVTEPYLCDLWDIRYLQGGIFTGGTVLTMLLNQVGAMGPGEDPQVVMEFRDETGAFVATIEVSTIVNVLELPLSILTELIPTAPPFGSVEILFPPATMGGFVAGIYSADGRFSIGMEGTCLVEIL